MRLICPSRVLRIIALAPGFARSLRRRALCALFVLLASNVLATPAAAQSDTVVVPVPLPAQEPVQEPAPASDQVVDPATNASGAAEPSSGAAAAAAASPASSAAPSEPVADTQPPAEIDPTLLYQVDVPVRDQSNGARREAGRDALDIVLKRLTGLSAPFALPAVAAAARDPEGFFARFGYQTGADPGAQVLRVQFSPPALFELIRSARLPVWPSARPVVSAWVLRDGRTQSVVSNTTRDSQLFAALEERARHWGLPLEPTSPAAPPAAAADAAWEPVSLALRPAGAEPALPYAVAGLWDLAPDELTALFTAPDGSAASPFVAIIRLSAPEQAPAVIETGLLVGGATPVDVALPVGAVTASNTVSLAAAEPSAGLAPTAAPTPTAEPAPAPVPIEPSSWRAELLLYAPGAPPAIPARGVFEAATPEDLANALVDQIVVHQLARFQVAAGDANAHRVTVLGVARARDLGAVLARLEGIEVVDDVRLTEAVGDRLEFRVQTSAPRDQLKALLLTDGRFVSAEEAGASPGESAALTPTSGLRLRWSGI